MHVFVCGGLGCPTQTQANESATQILGPKSIKIAHPASDYSVLMPTSLLRQNPPSKRRLDRHRASLQCRAKTEHWEMVNLFSKMWSSVLQRNPRHCSCVTFLQIFSTLDGDGGYSGGLLPPSGRVGAITISRSAKGVKKQQLF